MLKTNVYDMNGKQVGEIELSEAVFGIEPNESVVHDVVKNHLANCRQGSTRAPQWTHGGIVFAPKPRDYSYTLNKKVKRLALKSALSALAAKDAIVVIDEIKVDEIKTKTFKAFLDAVNVSGKTLVVTETVDEKVVKSARNIAGVTTTIATILSPYMILNNRKLVVSKAALAKIEEVYA